MKTVTRLVRLEPKKARRTRFSPQDQLRWLRNQYGRRVLVSVDSLLDRDRADG